MVNGFYILTIA